MIPETIVYPLWLKCPQCRTHYRFDEQHHPVPGDIATCPTCHIPLERTRDEAAMRFSLDWWKRRHEAPDGYFPKMDQHWNWRLYDEMPPWFLEMAQPCASDDALEIGCGYGQWMAPLSKLVRRVDGFDIHASLVDKFTEQMAAFPNTRMRLGDGLTIPFADLYSLVYSISVFQHMPRAIVEHYLQAIPSVLYRDGRALLHFRHADNDGPYSADIVANHTGDFSVGWTLDEVDAVLARAGLERVAYQASQSLIVVCKPL